MRNGRLGSMILLLVAVAPTLVAAPFDKGGLLGAGAAAAGQGGAVVARPGMAEALWWNPAGLGLRRDFQVGLGYGDLLGASRFEADFSHRGWMEVAAMGYGLGYRRQGFTVDVAEDEYAFGVAFPFTLDGRLQAGFSLRALQARVLDLRAPGYGVDLGLHYSAPGPVEGLSFGVAARDIQAALEWPAGPRSDPAQLFQVGVAWRFDESSSIEFDSEFVSDPSFSGRGSQGFKLGGERWWDWDRYGLKRLFALRLGYLQNSALVPAALGGQFSAGLGLQWQGLSVDYAYSQDNGYFGTSHRFSAGWAFGDAQAQPRRSPTPTVTPTPRPVALALALRAQPALFNPSQGARLQLRVTADEGATAANSQMEIRPLSGPAVVQRRVDGLPRDFAWDGRLPAGGMAQPGGYQAILRAFDAQGRLLGSADARFTLEVGGGSLRLSPDSDIFAPIAQSARPQARLAVGYDGAAAVRWSLRVRAVGQTGILRLIEGQTLPRSLQWDGRDGQGRPVPDGDYDVTLQVLDQAGVTLTAKAELSVDTRRPDLELEARPRVFKAGEGAPAVAVTTGLSGEAGIPSRWTLRVETLDGRAVKAFEGSGVPPSSVTWNAVDEAGRPVAPGSLYFLDYKVEMESGAVAATPRLGLASRLQEPELPFRVPLQTLRFADGDAVIALEDYAALKTAAAAVKQYSSDYVLQVEGHAKADEVGADGQGALELSFLRAKAVRDYLVESEGLDPARVQSAGSGSESPGSGDASRDARVEVILYAQ